MVIGFHLLLFPTLIIGVLWINKYTWKMLVVNKNKQIWSGLKNYYLMKLKNLHVDYTSGLVWSATWTHVSHLALLSSVCWLHPQIIAKHFTTCFLIHIQEEREGFFSSKLQKTNNLFFSWNDLGNILVCEETSVARRTLFTDWPRCEPNQNPPLELGGTLY